MKDQCPIRGFRWISSKSSKTNPLKKLRNETTAVRQTITASIGAFILALKSQRLSDVAPEPNPRLGLVMSIVLLSNRTCLSFYQLSKCPKRSSAPSLLTDQGARHANPFNGRFSMMRQVPDRSHMRGRSGERPQMLLQPPDHLRYGKR